MALRPLSEHGTHRAPWGRGAEDEADGYRFVQLADLGDPKREERHRQMVQEQPDDQGTRAPKDHPHPIDRQIDADGSHHGDGEERDENGLGGFHRGSVVLAISATRPAAWARNERPRRPSDSLSARGLSVGGL